MHSVARAAYQWATPGDTLLTVVCAWVCSLPPCSSVCARADCRETASQEGNRPRFVTPWMICVTPWGYAPPTPTPVAPTRRSLTRFGVRLKSHASRCAERLGLGTLGRWRETCELQAVHAGPRCARVVAPRRGGSRRKEMPGSSRVLREIREHTRNTRSVCVGRCAPYGVKRRRDNSPRLKPGASQFVRQPIGCRP